MAITAVVLATVWVAIAALVDFVDEWMITPRLAPRLLAADVCWLDGAAVKLGLRGVPALPSGTKVQRLYEQETIV